MADKYANPEVLVETNWVAEHLNDPNVRIVESDEDYLLYDTGHIPGAVKMDWFTTLQDPLSRRLPRQSTILRSCIRPGHRQRHHRRLLRRQEQLVRHLCLLDLRDVRSREDEDDERWAHKVDAGGPSADPRCPPLSAPSTRPIPAPEIRAFRDQVLPQSQAGDR